MTEIDPIQWAHMHEQMEAHLGGMARLAGAYYSELIKEGISSDHAILLVQDMINRILYGNLGSEDE